ncbi:MAG: cation transporter [Candidatus Aenigmatarchaeota archaeon]
MKTKIKPATFVTGISGMHCAKCAKTIEKKLNKTRGLLFSTVNYATEKAIINYDSSKTNEKIH